MSDQRNEIADESALSDDVEEVRENVAPISDSNPGDASDTGQPAAADSAAPADEAAPAQQPASEDAPADSAQPSEGGNAGGIDADVDSADAASTDAATSDADASESQPASSKSATPASKLPAVEEPDEPAKMDWYILKVQSNRETTIADALRRRVSIEGLDDFFGEIVVPSEMVTEFKGGKKKVVKRKLYPGYIVVHMAINDDTWFVVRETPGIGDFTGAGGKPTPMLPHEVQRIVQKPEQESEETPKLKINFNVGDRVKINEGTFESFEGEVSTIDDQSGRITVMIQIFNRTTPVELEYWQVETL